MNAGKMVTTNRGIAAGQLHREKKDKYDKGVPSNSAIIGYIDSPNNKRPCRLTAYSTKYFNKYNNGLPFIEAIDTCFKDACIDKYTLQYDAVSPNYRISNTAFSTVTVNYNFQTALHKDKGDYKAGFGTLVVCSDGIEGGQLLFPEYKVALTVKTGDFVAMNVHEYHCNSKIHKLRDNAYRLSFVAYLREKIVNCDKLNSILENMDNWNTTTIISEIFTRIGVNELPDKIYTDNAKKWWTMTAKHFQLTYKNKRYDLYDSIPVKRIHNLLPAWQYAQKTYI
jgi:hypothetical protein